ncbi:MAG TPA: hypothetical protein EYM39_02520 [Candidatus Latescibacteria bacterium]|nr:hypothetical protein [Candidatus Latescibacterota bacterium]
MGASGEAGVRMLLYHGNSGSRAVRHRRRQGLPEGRQHLSLPRSVAAPVDDFVRAWQREGDACWALADGAFVAGKELFASLIGADASEIATVENTSMGLSIVASLIAPEPGSLQPASPTAAIRHRAGQLPQ